MPPGSTFSIIACTRQTPSAIKAEGAKSGLKNVTYPTCDVAGQAIDTGPKARCFAQYMNIHALEATGGFTYSQMGIYEAKPNTPKSQLEPGGGTRSAISSSPGRSITTLAWSGEYGERTEIFRAERDVQDGVPAAPPPHWGQGTH